MAAHKGSDGNVHPARQQNLHSAGRTKIKKATKNPKHPKVRSPKETPGVGALKNEIRNLTRLLEHDRGLPAHVRMEKERARAKYKLDLEELEEARRAKETLARYHMVRFFERKKAERQLKRRKTALSNSSPESDDYQQLNRALHEAEVDLNYTTFSPLAEKYVSLWGKEKAQGGQQEQDIHSEKGKPEMWYIVERAMAEETLDLIRNFGRLTVHSTPSKARAALTEPPQRDEEATALALLIRTVQRSTQAEKNEAKTNAAVRSTAAIVGGAEQKSDDEMSDGGFFEE